MQITLKGVAIPSLLADPLSAMVRQRASQIAPNNAILTDNVRSALHASDSMLQMRRSLAVRCIQLPCVMGLTQVTIEMFLVVYTRMPHAPHLASLHDPSATPLRQVCYNKARTLTL